MRIFTCQLILMTTFLGFSKSEPEIFLDLIFDLIHGPGDNAVMIAHRGSGRQICAN